GSGSAPRRQSSRRYYSSGYRQEDGAPRRGQWDGRARLRPPSLGQMHTVPRLTVPLSSPAEPAQLAEGRRAVFPTSDAGATKERRRSEEGRQRGQTGGLP